ncbi:hypothetical protein [Streptococcus cuniculipharyngis]|uniref:Uncharacterized protein n=1 Tax=Streptococcus cuniculipharyngis TaxID=1562651 RepID=A0A5C5SAI7_9STRE|nr:hypothetical protein [Streptococcus cuniculipharyngis]TWS96681.1 hypothetical protein FRX57_06865 [Streptococcus cuniculipharyngis]
MVDSSDDHALKDFPQRVTLLHGLRAVASVDKTGEWLLTDQEGWKVYALLTELASGDLIFAPRWQVGCCWQGQNLIIYPEASLHKSPFEDGDEKVWLKQGKGLTRYTSRKKWRNNNVRQEEF